MRKKGKVHPFTTSSSSSSSSNSNTDSQSVLKLLPAAILTLVSFLSLEDREVLAYMLTRSLKSTTPSFFPSHDDTKRTSNSKNHCAAAHNSPALFDCDCFHCYTSFWLRWDSSPNRELIHQAIEAFDDHLNSTDHLNNGKSKRRDKLGRRKTDKIASVARDSPPVESPGNHESAPDIDEVEVVEEDSAAAEAAPVVTVESTHKGLVRKVLPDFMGIFHSRYWSLWSPNV